MRIVYFYQYFSTPNGSWGTRVYDFCKEWVAQGHDVTVVTSVYAKSDLKATRLIEDQVFDGIKVKVLNIRIDNKQPVFQRIWTFIQYSLLSSYYAITLKADLVIASSGPITAGLPGLVARYIRRRPLIFEVRDLWPDGAIELGIIKNPMLRKLAYWLEKQCYRASRFVITLSPGMSTDIRTRFPWVSVDDVPNAADIKLFSTRNDLQEIQLPARSYAIYTGNIGKVNHSTWLFEAARILREKGRNDIYMLLIGDGQLKASLKEKAAAAGLKNFIIMDPIPKVELVKYVQSSIASLVPLMKSKVLDTSSPNKLFESLAAGVPVVQTSNGWINDLINEYQVGYTIDPNDPLSLAECLIELKDNPSIGASMGVRSYSLAVDQFDKKKLAHKMLGHLLKVHQMNDCL
ncbi:MAG: glycosyltransferase family 4 protein [bacterium]|jgi:glycosyltransferase involved in cell wall biosynthesis